MIGPGISPTVHQALLPKKAWMIDWLAIICGSLTTFGSDPHTTLLQLLRFVFSRSIQRKFGKLPTLTAGGQDIKQLSNVKKKIWGSN